MSTERTLFFSHLQAALEEILAVEIVAPEGGHEEVAEIHRIARTALAGAPGARWETELLEMIQSFGNARARGETCNATALRKAITDHIALVSHLQAVQVKDAA